MKAFFFLAITLIYDFILADVTPTSIAIDSITKGKIPKDDSSDYYLIEIPDSVIENSQNLIIRVKESSDADSALSDFSDPDIFVSQTNTNPNKRSNSAWYSDTFGEDYISINKDVVKPKEKFYIGVYCQYKCEYELSVHLMEEMEMEAGRFYTALLMPGYQFVVKFHQTRQVYNHLEIIAYSPTMTPYKMYVSKSQTPTSLNTLQVLPSWIGGYSVNIEANSYDSCTDCYYYILLTAETIDTEVRLFIQYEDTVNEMNTSEPVYASMKPNRRNCYSFEVKEKHKNEKLILTTTLFSGSADIYVNPWELKTTLTEFKWHDSLVGEDSLIITPEMRKVGNTETGKIYVCILSSDFTSYFIKSYYEGQSDRLQAYNYLWSATPIHGVLLPDHLTKYRVVEFNPNSNLTVSLEAQHGNPKLYGYICEYNPTCYFSKDQLDNLVKNNQVILPEFKNNKSVINLLSKDNTCHQKIKEEDSLQNERVSIACGLAAIVYCSGDEECEYTITYKMDVNYAILIPRKPHYQIVPANEVDQYGILIEDPDIEELVIVLNSITGDADLSVYRNESLIDASMNEAFIPDVIQIKRKQGETLKGFYRVNVTGATFASYSIYYYTHKQQSIIINNFVGLRSGHIIKDFIDAERQDYKIYSYKPRLSNGNPLDVRITLTPEKSEYSIYVYTKSQQINYKNETKSFTNSFWNTTLSNEIIIDKNDPNYPSDGQFFIAVLLNYVDLYDTTDLPANNHTGVYYIGATTEKKSFILHDAIPHLMTFTETLKQQTYYYIHNDTSIDLFMSINEYYGKVDVKANIKGDSEIISLKDDSKHHTITYTIPSDKLKQKCANNPNNCELDITISKSSIEDANYLIVVKSHSNRAEKLVAGVSLSDTLSAGEYKYYYIHTHLKERGLIRLFNFYATMELYVILQKNNFELKQRYYLYPNHTHHDYKGSYASGGKNLVLTDEMLKTCDNNCLVMISVFCKELGFDSDYAKFTLEYFNDTIKIDQNNPYSSSIKAKEIQYFNVKIPKNTENLYISLMNMNGDADIFVNKGETFPLTNQATWASETTLPETIFINKDDPYFIERNITDIGGQYIIAVYGYTSTYYTLYITTHKDKILLATDNSQVSCTGENKGDKCYIQYRDYGQYYSSAEMIIAHTEYFYGSGIIYSRYYNGDDLDILKDFPSSNNFDYSSSQENTRNLLRIPAPKVNTPTTMLLITIEFNEKSLVNFRAVRQYFSSIRYLDLDSDNIFYVRNVTNFVFYNGMLKDLDVKIEAYSGKFDVETSVISEVANQEKQIIFTSSLDRLDNKKDHKVIATSFQVAEKDINFKVTPIVDSTVSISLSYPQSFSKLKMNKIKSVIINNQESMFYGYFDMIPEFTDVTINIQSVNPDTWLYLYVKYIHYKKDTHESKEVFNSIPSETNHHYKATSDEMLNKVSLKIPGIKEPDAGDKTQTIILFTVSVVFNKYVEYLADKSIDILITPRVNTATRSVIEPYKTVSSSIRLDEKEIQIYDLQKIKPEHDLLVIELSTCEGAIDFIISDRLFHFREDASPFPVDNVENSGGRMIIKIRYPKPEMFLGIVATEGIDQEDCQYNTSNCNKQKQSRYILNYYTTKFNDSMFVEATRNGRIEYEIISESEVRIKWPLAIFMKGNKRDNDTDSIKYFLFLSKEEKDYENMQSLCYLSNLNYVKYEPESDLKNTAVIKNLEPGTHYFVNIVAKSSKYVDAFAYSPIEIQLNEGGTSALFKFIVVTVIAILIFIAYKLFRKLKFMRKVLEYETSDVRNMSSIPKTDREMNEVVQAREKQKYSQLTEEPSQI